MKKILSVILAIFFICAFQVSEAMNLNVHDGDLRATIMMVARTGRLNVSVDDSVKGKISVTLIDVYPEDALEIIAKTTNLNLVYDGIDAYIVTAAQYTSIMSTYVLPIRYGDAEFLRKAVAMSLNKNIRKVNSDERGYSGNSDYNTTSETSIKNNPDGTTTISTKSHYDGETSVSNENNDNSNSKTEQNISVGRVMINPDVNALILFGTPDEYERAKKLLQTLDVELKQVSVEAKIVAIDKNASKNLGVEWFWSSVPQYPTNRTETSGVRNFNDETGYGIFKFGRSYEGYPFEWYYGAKINALVNDGKAKILSRPNVTTIQGREAVINVGQSIPIPKVSTNNITTMTTYEYRDVGIILKYTPRVNNDGSVTATLHTEVSTPYYVEDMGVYRFNTRSADTTVTVRDGEPMIIGGLIGAEEEKSLSKIPFLGDLPILGALFKNHRKSKTESELMIFLTAHVLNGAEK